MSKRDETGGQGSARKARMPALLVAAVALGSLAAGRPLPEVPYAWLSEFGGASAISAALIHEDAVKAREAWFRLVFRGDATWGDDLNASVDRLSYRINLVEALAGEARGASGSLHDPALRNWTPDALHKWIDEILERDERMTMEIRAAMQDMQASGMQMDEAMRKLRGAAFAAIFSSRGNDDLPSGCVAVLRRDFGLSPSDLEGSDSLGGFYRQAQALRADMGASMLEYAATPAAVEGVMAMAPPEEEGDRSDPDLPSIFDVMIDRFGLGEDDGTPDVNEEMEAS